MTASLSGTGGTLVRMPEGRGGIVAGLLSIGVSILRFLKKIDALRLAVFHQCKVLLAETNDRLSVVPGYHDVNHYLPRSSPEDCSGSGVLCRQCWQVLLRWKAWNRQGSR